MFRSETIRQYGTGIMFEPVPMEMLFSDAQKPQVLVVVDDLESLCINLNCDYAYEVSSAEITAQTYAEDTKLLTITGTSLPTADATVKFGGVTCASPTLGETEITCTLPNAPRGGDHKAEVRDSKGLIPYASGVADITIAITVTNVSPSAANALGGDVLTVTGTGFPIDKQFVTVSFDDGTSCNVLTSTETQITCEVVEMSANDGNDRQLSVTVSNTRYQTRRRNLFSIVTTTSSETAVQQTTGLPTVTAIDKSDVSPIIK